MLTFNYAAPEERRKPLIDGHQLMQALGIAPGPQVGQLLEAIREAQAIGSICSIDEALSLARRLIA
jgi:hypothetical protein